MPIYEYYCPDNNRIYQFFAKTLAQGETIPKCPDNPAFKMVKLVSGFAIGGATKKSGGDAPTAGPGDDAGGGPAGPGAPGGDAGAPDDPRMEAAFSQLEREMESIDENDPRAMGRMMRRMSELTGEKLDGEMEEMVRKLEEGEDPEKLEEQFGDMMGEGGPDDEMGGMGGFGGGRSAPTRDPHLYDY
ncbi:MAG: FmdB family transcriptional regulator [Opitutaceae bacterium]|nr:FmdB family transcriptional regulator [Opitutaceae bacterium]